MSLELEDAGFTAIQAFSGNHALKLIAQYKPDLVISDIRMPDGDGIFLLKEIKKRYPELPVVLFITAFADLTDAEAFNMGSEAIFRKPVNYEKLIARVHECLKHKSCRWVRKDELITVDFSLHLTFGGYQAAVRARTLNIGRGGMFLQLDSPLPKVNQCIAFHISFEDSKHSPLSGKAICRWVRNTASGDDLPKGIGVEFLDVDEETSRRLLNLMSESRTTTFIPMS